MSAKARAAFLVALVMVGALLRGSRAAYASAFVVALSAFAAVLLYRYVNVPALGPLPAMYERVWFAEKSLSALAEATGAILAGVGFARERLWRRARHPSRHGT